VVVAISQLPYSLSHLRTSSQFEGGENDTTAQRREDLPTEGGAGEYVFEFFDPTSEKQKTNLPPPLE